MPICQHLQSLKGVSNSQQGFVKNKLHQSILFLWQVNNFCESRWSNICQNFTDAVDKKIHKILKGKLEKHCQKNTPHKRDVQEFGKNKETHVNHHSTKIWFELH